ncbi:AAA family ATPase [Candidatus Chlorohelix sp.]|uniref:AAA family ATPase n=1 Tax=Candidatus Chlorohelix sp. TaxID=3139201 RepID=UPI00314507FA
MDSTLLQNDETNQPPAQVMIDLPQSNRDRQIHRILEDFDKGMIGLQAVKTRIREIAAFLLIDRMREQVGLNAERPVLHMCFTGRPGTGKTTVAMKMASILYELGYIRRNHVVVVTRDDLVGQYVGHTAPKTKEVLKKAMGGVLFIDEAYYLYRRENERDYGQEAIEVLLQVMENQRDDLVVIMAGYKDRMDEFFSSNPGVRSRIAHHIDFPDYNLDELMQISDLMLKQQMYYLDTASIEPYQKLVASQMEHEHFSNARTIRNLLDLLKLRHANRLFNANKPVTKDDLARLDLPDIPDETLIETGSDN